MEQSCNGGAWLKSHSRSLGNGVSEVEVFTWSQKHVFYIGWGSERGKSPVSAWDGCYFLSEQGEDSKHCGVGPAQ